MSKLRRVYFRHRPLVDTPALHRAREPLRSRSRSRRKRAIAALGTLAQGNVSVAESIGRTVAASDTRSRVLFERRPVAIRPAALGANRDGVAEAATGAFFLLSESAAVVRALGEACDCGGFGYGDCRRLFRI